MVFRSNLKRAKFRICFTFYKVFTSLTFVRQDFLNAADLAVGQADFDAVRVKFRIGQQILDDADGLAPRSLILFEDDRDADAGANIISVFSVHISTNIILPHFPGSCPKSAAKREADFVKKGFSLGEEKFNAKLRGRRGREGNRGKRQK